MTPENHLSENDRLADEAEIARLQAEAAEKAATVGSFRSNFRRMIDTALTESRIQNKVLAQERMTNVDDASKNIGDLRIANMEAQKLGDAHIKGGRGRVRLSKERFASINSKDDAIQMQQAGGHELGHAKAVHLKGALTLDGERKQNHLQWHEAFAEKEGNKFVGMSLEEHRDGQPDELYGEGQDDITEIRNIVGEELIDRVFTQTGDLSEIQEVLDKKGRGHSPKEIDVSLAA